MDRTKLFEVRIKGRSQGKTAFMKALSEMANSSDIILLPKGTPIKFKKCTTQKKTKEQ